MDRSDEIAAAVGEIRDLLRDGRKSQVEALEFLRANAEKTKSVIDRSVALQEGAVRRQKAILALVLPLIVVCLAAIGYLILRIRF